MALVSGNGNAALGDNSAGSLASGASNIFIGSLSGQNLTTGSNNIVIGAGILGGSSLTTGDSNIDIGNAGVATESGTIRVGTSGVQALAFMAGIYGVATGLPGTAVVIDSAGQLGTISSSRRYKEDIQPMGDASERLLKLRPVTFRYKKTNALGQKPIQYGLIAEEVAEVLPELVVDNANGQPDTVAYHLLPAMLLNELQKEHGQIVAQGKLIRDQTEQIAQLETQAAEVGSLKTKLADLERLTALLAAASGVDPARVQQVSQRTVDSSQAVAAR
jgi:hypothetical protein